MSNVYITQKKKKEWEDKIAELESWGVITELHPRYQIWKIHKHLLSEAIILPEEKSWRRIANSTGTMYSDDADILSNLFPKGVIINPKNETSS